MYVPPALRNENINLKIENLCDEFFHIEAIPEVNMKETCTECNKCRRKSVTCVLRLCNSTDECIYDKIYKNKSTDKERFAIHAESFIVSDTQLRKKLSSNQKLHLYLTYQPCHFSGGHFRVRNISCTELLIQFYEKVLQPFGIQVTIHFSYLYRAHWEQISPKYDQMILNSIEGIKLTKRFFKLRVMTREDYLLLTQYCSEQEKTKFFDGYYDGILEERNPLITFFQNVIDGYDTHPEYMCDVCSE